MEIFADPIRNLLPGMVVPFFKLVFADFHMKHYSYWRSFPCTEKAVGGIWHKPNALTASGFKSPFRLPRRFGR